MLTNNKNRRMLSNNSLILDAVEKLRKKPKRAEILEIENEQSDKNSMLSSDPESNKGKNDDISRNMGQNNIPQFFSPRTSMIFDKLTFTP